MKKALNMNDIEVRDFNKELTRLQNCVKTMNATDLGHELLSVMECVAVEHYLLGYEAKLKMECK